MQIIHNPFRGRGFGTVEGIADGKILTDPAPSSALYQACPAAHETPLTEFPELAASLGITSLSAKDERGRMGLGSFKALGAAHAIAKRASANGIPMEPATALVGETFICASAGNHGLAMAAGAAVFGARAVVYLAETVPEGFAAKLWDKKADVVREGGDYEASMAAAQAAADSNGWQLLSDSSWLGYTEPARDVMEGYLIMGTEVTKQMARPPTHVFLQAGVGGLAASCAAMARRTWGEYVTIIVVEPETASALKASIEAGHPVHASGPVSNMGRLDCKEPSHLALKYLAREADLFMTITDDEAMVGVELLDRHGIATSPSGGAGFAGLCLVIRAGAIPGLGNDSRVLVYISEGPEDI